MAVGTFERIGKMGIKLVILDPLKDHSRRVFADPAGGQGEGKSRIYQVILKFGEKSFYSFIGYYFMEHPFCEAKRAKWV